jgi:hypothetical protein
MDCLLVAHNEMLQVIYDPRNRFPIMESNPINSKDILHGVPSIFNELMNDSI